MHAAAVARVATSGHGTTSQGTGAASLNHDATLGRKNFDWMSAGTLIIGFIAALFAYLSWRLIRQQLHKMAEQIALANRQVDIANQQIEIAREELDVVGRDLKNNERMVQAAFSRSILSIYWRDPLQDGLLTDTITITTPDVVGVAWDRGFEILNSGNRTSNGFRCTLLLNPKHASTRGSAVPLKIYDGKYYVSYTFDGETLYPGLSMFWGVGPLRFQFTPPRERVELLYLAYDDYGKLVGGSCDRRYPQARHTVNEALSRAPRFILILLRNPAYVVNDASWGVSMV
jgi:hypothetical protein